MRYWLGPMPYGVVTVDRMLNRVSLKVVSATFLLVSLLSVNESTYQTRKSVFYFTSKALFVLEKIKFKFHDVIKCLSIKEEIHFTENLVSKHSLFMKFDQFMSYYKRKNFIKKFPKNCGLKTSSRPFCVCKELSTTSIGK